jgi:iodotyrosine deiodinase
MSTLKIIEGYPYIKYQKEIILDNEMIDRSEVFYQLMDKRRSVREFSDRPIPKEVIENIIKTASTAPSGAHKQPWTFCVIENPTLKSQIREAAEKEEYESYNSRMSSEWIEDLKPLGTDWQKPFLEIAPFLIIVFRKIYETDKNGNKKPNYYVQESVGIACGLLLSAIQNTGLVALTHTPSPMNFLTKLLKRPENEKPFLLIPIGYPADNCFVPDIKRKEMNEIAVFY